MKMGDDLYAKMMESYEDCPFYFHDYANYHKKLFDGKRNEGYSEYVDYAIWMTTMGLLETLAIVDESYNK